MKYEVSKLAWLILVSNTGEDGEILLRSLGWSRTHSMYQAGLELAAIF